jgi:hypothetical protein
LEKKVRLRIFFLIASAQFFSVTAALPHANTLIGLPAFYLCAGGFQKFSANKVGTARYAKSFVSLWF